MEIVGGVDLGGLCRLPFLMGVVARFWGEVCGVVLAGEGEGEGEELMGVGEMVWRFKREVEDKIEEMVGTREFEGVCGELGVWESGDEEEEGFEDGDGNVGERVCWEECESCVRGKEGYVTGAGVAVDDGETDEDDGEDGSGAPPEDHTDDDGREDDDSDFCSNPFEEEDEEDAPRPTIFWTTIAAPGEDHHTLFERAMREVNERLTFIEHVIGRAVRSVAMKCDGSPATQFYTFYIPATRSILSDLAEEVTREIIKARERSASREATVPDPTSLDPLRFYFLRRIFLGDHPALASTMQDSMLDQKHRRDTMHVFWQNAVIDQTLSEEELEEFCERLSEKETFDEMSEYIPTLQLDQ